MTLTQNPHIQQAAEEMMFLHLVYTDDDGDELGEASVPMLTACCTAFGLPADENDQTPEQSAFEDEILETVFETSYKLIHQRAVHGLVELTMDTPEFRAHVPDAERRIPNSEIPTLFRVAINSVDCDKQEAAILECALSLFEQNPDETTRTPQQEEFYGSLVFWMDDNDMRVKYAPENVTVQ